MKNQKVFKLIICALCVSLFTACGKRDSKQRGRADLKTKNTAAASTPELSAQEKERKLRAEQEEEQRRQEEQEQANSESEPPANEDAPLSSQDQTDENPQVITGELPPADSGNEQGSEANNTEDHQKNDIDLSQKNQTGTEDSPSDSIVLHSGTNSSSTQQRANTRPGSSNSSTTLTKTQNRLIGNNEIDFFLKYYKAAPFNKDKPISQEALTGFDTESGFMYTDLKSNDQIMKGLKNVFARDIKVNKENPNFEKSSLLLSQAITQVMPIKRSDGTFNLAIYLNTHDEYSEGQSLLHFSGHFNDQGVAVLGPTSQSHSQDYIAEIKCLDSNETCHTQQITLSYFFATTDESKQGQIEGKLCKRAYIVSRMGDATLNMNTDIITNHLENIAVCEGPEAYSPNNAITCFAALAYNGFEHSQFKSCRAQANRQKQSPECLRYAQVPSGIRTKHISLHSFAVAHGEASFLLSFLDSHDSYTSLFGKLLSTHDKSTILTKGNLNISYENMEHTGRSVFLENLTYASLNGVDHQSTMQLKLYFEHAEPENQYLFLDVVPRFSPASSQRIQYDFSNSVPDPVAGKVDHPSNNDSDGICSDEKSLQDMVEISDEKYRDLITWKKIQDFRSECAGEIDAVSVSTKRCLNNRATQYVESKLKHQRNAVSDEFTSFPWVKIHDNQNCVKKASSHSMEEARVEKVDETKSSTKATIRIYPHTYEGLVTEKDLPELRRKCHNYENRSAKNDCMSNYANYLVKKRRPTYRADGNRDETEPNVTINYK